MPTCATLTADEAAGQSCTALTELVCRTLTPSCTDVQHKLHSCYAVHVRPYQPLGQSVQKSNVFVIAIVVCGFYTAKAMFATHANIRSDTPCTWQNSTGMKDINKHKCNTASKHHMLITSEELVITPWTVNNSAFQNHLHRRLIYICLRLSG